MKTCPECGKAKPLEDFYADRQMADGRRNTCKACSNARRAAHRKLNADYYREYDRQRARDPKRKAMRARSWAEWGKTERGRAAIRLSQAEYVKRNPEKTRAREAVRLALRNGWMARPGACEQCQKPCKPHAHHDDYTRPLDVRWLCRTCHVAVHRGDDAPVSNAAF